MLILAIVFMLVVSGTVATIKIDQWFDKREASKPKPPKTGMSLNDLLAIIPSFVATQKSINETFAMFKPIYAKWERIKKLIG
jgi:hypothetical protein